MESWDNSLLTKPDKSSKSSKVYNVLVMLYTNNDYKSSWLKYVENTLIVTGFVLYWRKQAVDNIDSFIYTSIVRARHADQFNQDWYI